MSDNQRTRPSEAEVTADMVEEARDIALDAVEYVGAANYDERIREARGMVREAFAPLRAALSTPPLPSAPEPVAWMRKPWFVYAEGDTLHGTCDTSRADKWIAKDPMWIHKVFLRTTPPAASDNATEADRAS